MAKILNIIHELSLGGAARSLAAIAKYSSRRSGHRHAVISLVPPQPSSLELARDAGLRVVAGATPEILRAEMADADIVLLHWWNVPEMRDLLAAPMPETRLAIFYHVAGNRIPHIITSALADFADVNVPCNPYSQLDLEVFAGMDETVRRDKVSMVYGAPDFDRLAGLVKQPHAGFNVGYIGTIDFVKLHPRYVEMSAPIRIPDARFIVCGDGGALPVLREKAAAAGQAHRFDIRGYVSDIRPVIAQLDVYGYPLCEDTYAGSELNLQEIMFAGIPPVVFPYGGVRRLVVNDYTGLVVHGEAEYAEAIEHLHRHPEERLRIGTNAAEYARQLFGAENAAVKMDAIFERMLRGPKRSRRWTGPARGPGDGAAVYADTLGPFGGAFSASREARSLADAWGPEEEIAGSTRLAFLSGILAYRERYPADPFLRYWAGLVFDRMGSPAEAALEYAEAVKLGFPHWRARWRLFEAARAIGRGDLVQSLHRHLEAEHPGYRREVEAARGGVPAAAPEGPDHGRPAPPSDPVPAAQAVPPARASASDWSPRTGSQGEDPLERAESAIGAGRLEEAEGILAAFLARHPGHARALNDLGIVQHRTGRKDKARHSFLAAIKADLSQRGAAANLANSLLEMGLHKEALDLCYRFLDEAPDEEALLQAARAAEEGWADKLLARSRIRELNYRRKDYQVTAIVSTYKSEAFMRECLEDLESQSIADQLEIVVVDADSPQGEDGIVEEFQRRYDNIRYIRTPERIGIYPAWNLAVRASSGAFLTPFSTNDRLNPDAYRILRDALLSRPDAALAYGDTYLTAHPHQKWGSHIPTPDYGGVFQWPDYSFNDLMMNCRVGPHPMWRREVHELVGYFDGRYKAIGDQDFWLRVGWKRELLHIPVFTGIAWITKESLSGESSSMGEIMDIHNKHTKARVEWMRRKLEAEASVPAVHPAPAQK